MEDQTAHVVGDVRQPDFAGRFRDRQTQNWMGARGAVPRCDFRLSWTRLCRADVDFCQQRVRGEEGIARPHQDHEYDSQGDGHATLRPAGQTIEYRRLQHRKLAA